MNIQRQSIACIFSQSNLLAGQKIVDAIYFHLSNVHFPLQTYQEIYNKIEVIQQIVDRK